MLRLGLEMHLLAGHRDLGCVGYGGLEGGRHGGLHLNRHEGGLLDLLLRDEVVIGQSQRLFHGFLLFLLRRLSLLTLLHSLLTLVGPGTDHGRVDELFIVMLVVEEPSVFENVSVVFRMVVVQFVI